MAWVLRLVWESGYQVTGTDERPDVFIEQVVPGAAEEAGDVRGRKWLPRAKIENQGPEGSGIGLFAELIHLSLQLWGQVGNQ